MKDSDFELLVTSVRQAGRIRRGEMVPTRKFEVRPEDVKALKVAAENPSAVSAALDPRRVSNARVAAAGSRRR